MTVHLSSRGHSAPPPLCSFLLQLSPPAHPQVKKRCRWLVSFAQDALQPIRGSQADPFDGAEVDANALGWALAVVTSRAFRTRGPDQVRAAAGGEVSLAQTA